jgi:NAD(P)-dependent dehydrogenase (short-subunit alcohol dehydrogenase family)
MQELSGRVAVVTGAGSGIGLAIAAGLSGVGAHVLMVDRDREAVERAAADLRERAADVHAFPADVADPEAVERAAAHAVDRFGALHIAVNNAGVVNGGRSWELDLAEWRHVLDVNLWGVIHGIRAFVPRMLATGDEGHVVNTASLAAVLPFPGIGPYVASKHGVLGLSEVLRADLEAADAPIGVSVVMPGMIRTGMNPVGTVEAPTVAANVVDAIRRGRFYVFTDDHNADDVEARFRNIVGARADVIP